MAATVDELAALMEGAMRNPAPPGPGICRICRGFPNPGFETDYNCGFNPNHFDAVAPISYAPRGGLLYTALRDYKRSPYVEVRNRFYLRLAAVLWKFLDEHEACIAAAAGALAFDVVAVVPSKTPEHDERRALLRTLVGMTCLPTADRFERLLRPTGAGNLEREYDPPRYEASRRLDGEHVLLIDDTWTTGASAQNAGYALRKAGAATIGFVAIGRYMVREYQDHGARLDALPRRFDWAICPMH